MAFLMSTLVGDVATALGLSSAAADTTNLTSRLLSKVNQAVDTWSRGVGARYYERDLSYKPDSIAAYPTDTVTTNIAVDPYSLVFAGAGGTLAAKHLLGAVIEQTNEDNNAVGAITTLSARMKSNVSFTNGTVTVKQRSILHDSTTAKFYAPFTTRATIIVNDYDSYTIPYVDDVYFWQLPEIFDPLSDRPTCFTCLNCTETGIPHRLVMDTVWPLSPDFRFTARLKTIPTAVTAGTDAIDMPDEAQQALTAYIIAEYKAEKGYNFGAEQFFQAKKILDNFRSFK